MGQGGDIHISLHGNKKQMSLVIKDNGEGISRENLPFVCDPFFTTKPRTMNFGLGLSYCYNVMKQHGGTLEIESGEDAGTTVSLGFPVKKVVRIPSNLPQRWVAHV